MKHSNRTFQQQRILCYAPYNMWKLHGMWEMTILHTLKLRGADFRYVMCDGVFTECDIFWKATSPRHALSCAMCKDQTEEFARNMGIPFQWLGQYLNKSDFTSAKAWVGSIPVDAYTTAEYGNWQVGTWVKSSVHSHFRMSELDFTDPEVKRVYEHYLYSGLIACLGIDRLLDDYRPDTLLLFNGRMSSTRVALSLAQQKGIRTITHERGFLKESILLKENGDCLDLRPIKQVWMDWGTVPLNRIELDQITSYLRDRENGQNLSWKRFSPTPQPLPLVRRQLKIPEQSTVWVLFTSSDDEIIAADGLKGVFTTQHEWISRTINYVKSRPDIRLIVRIHPNTAGKNATGNNQQQLDALEALTAQSADNISFIMPEDDISSYSLMEIANIGLVYQSTVGLEMACKGKVVLVSAGSMISDLPFVKTIYSAAGYEDVLDGYLNVPFDYRATVIARLAYRYAYGIFFRYNIPFPLVGMPDPHNGVLNYTSIEELLPNKDPALDRVARIVLDKERVCRPPEEHEKNRSLQDEDTWFDGNTGDDSPEASILDSSSARSVPPLVSVIIPCYNYGHYLSEAVNSVINQAVQDFEIIIVNDGSSDNTREISEKLITEYPRHSIRLINQENSGQPAISRNNAIRLSQSRFIICLDADDMIAPTMLQECLGLLESQPETAIAYTDRLDFDGAEGVVQAGEYDFSRLIHANHISYCALYRREVWERVGGYRENVKAVEDWDFWIAAGALGYYGKRIPLPLFRYRRHDTGIFQEALKDFDRKHAQIIINNAALYDPALVALAEKMLGAATGAPPLVSVIVPTHNRPDMLRDAIQSILVQTFQDFEIIVVNDAGQDAAHVITSFNSRKITYLRHENNKGLAAARNTGIRAARGKYIAYLDDDDVYYVNHLEKLVQFLESSDFYVAYTDSYRAMQELLNGRYVTTKRETPYSFDFDYDRILVENFIPVLCVMHRRECLEKSGCFDETLDRHEDWDLWIRMSRHYKFSHIPKITCEFTYRSDGSGMTSSSLPKFLGTLQRIYQKYESDVKTNKAIEQYKLRSLFNILCSVYNFIGDRINTFLTIDELPYQELSVAGATISQIRSSYYWKKATQCSCQRETIVFLDKAISEDVQNHPAKVALVSKYIEAGRFTDAVSLLATLVELNPLEPLFASTLKNIEEKLHQEREHASRDNMVVELLTVQAVKVSIIIPVFNQLPFTKQCLDELFTTLTAAIPSEIIIVDNGSSDGTGEYLRSLIDQVAVLSNHENVGFAKACNQGAQVANGKYLLFLNNDTEPQQGWLEPLLNSAEQDENVAAVGSKLLFPDGTIQHAGVVIADDRVTPDPLVGKHVYYGFYSDAPEVNITKEYQALTAASLLIRKDAFEAVRGFDEAYWNGYEDVDLCFKLGQKGWKLIYQPASVVVHHESKSGSERFAKAAQNIQRLHNKWLGTIKPDLIIHTDSRVEWLEVGALVAPAAKPLVSIIIPLFNQAQLTKACVEAIRATAGDPGRYELILADNGSVDWTPEYLKSLSTSVVVISNKENQGFAKACNQGGRVAKGEYLLFLNNDTVPQPGWLDALLAGARGENADIVGAKLLYPNGRVQHAGVAFSRNGIGYHIFKNFAADSPAVNKKRFMQCVTAACMLVSRQFFDELGGFDEQFRNGFEDVDFCLRAGLTGKRILYAPAAVVTHHEEQSEGRKLHDRENMQRYLTRWQGRVRCDDEELYAAEGFSVEWRVDGTCVVRPRSVQETVQQTNLYPLIPLVEHSSSSILQKLSSSQRTKGVLKRYTTEN